MRAEVTCRESHECMLHAISASYPSVWGGPSCSSPGPQTFTSGWLWGLRMELAAGRSEAIAAAAQEQMEEPEERPKTEIFPKLLPC